MFYALLNVLLVMIGAMIAFVEERFSHDQMGVKALPWINHGASWADLILISIIVALVMPYHEQWQASSIILYGSICGAIAVAFHVLWALTMPVPSYIVEPSASGFARLPVGGYYHLFYMWAVLTIIVLFYFATPGVPRLWVSILLTIYLPLAVMQPGYYIYKITEGAGRVDLPARIISIALWAFIWGVGYQRP